MSVQAIDVCTDSFLAYCDKRAVSLDQVIQAEKLTEKQIEEKMRSGTFPLPAGLHGGASYWRLGDIVRWREGWS